MSTGPAFSNPGEQPSAEPSAAAGDSVQHVPPGGEPAGGGGSAVETAGVGTVDGDTLAGETVAGETVAGETVDGGTLDGDVSRPSGASDLAAGATVDAASEAGGNETHDDGAERKSGTDDVPPIEGEELRGAIEAILLVIDEPVTSTVLAQVIKTPQDAVAHALEDLRRDYDETGRGFELRQVGGGWRLYTRASFAPYVERFVLDGQQARLTQAALETLAVVAYRQPVSRSRVSAVRGVNVDGVMRTLVSRGLVEEAGAEEESGAVLYRTTPYFLERLGLRDLGELPKLADFLPETTTIDQLEDELSSEGRDV